MYNPDKFKAVRSKPSQARGKERVRVILAAALKLFGERGIEEVTTNEIAKAAGIPIGSLYRYYPNKDAIVAAIIGLYADEISAIFAEIGGHPFLEHLSWDEVLILMVDSWVNYSRLNGSFVFLYAEKANPRLQKLNRERWEKFVTSFRAVLQKRCPEVTSREMTVCFQLSLAAAEMGINDYTHSWAGPDLHHEAVSAVAAYMLRCCNNHRHGLGGKKTKVSMP